MNFKKTPKQIEASKLLSGPAKHVLFRGGSRSGKTFLMVRAIIIRASKTKSRHLIIRKIFAHVKQSIWFDTLPKVLELCFPELLLKCLFNKSDWFITLPNGSEIWFGGLDDKERTDKILGKEYSTIYFNECSEMNYDSVGIAYTRLSEKNSLQKKFYYDCNPPKEAHWSNKLFLRKIDPNSNCDQPISNPQNYATIKINPIDNQENLDPTYIPEILENLPPLLKLRFLDGEYGSDDADIIRPEWIIPGMPQSEKLFKVMFIDPAVSEKQTADDTAIVTIAFDEYFGLYHEIETVSGKWSFDDIKMNVKASIARHTPDQVYVETVQAQDWLRQDLNSQGIPAQAFKPDRDKVRKAIYVQDLFSTKLVRINSSKTQKQLLEISSDNTNHDDCADAAISALLIMKGMHLTKKDHFKTSPYEIRALTPQDVMKSRNQDLAMLYKNMIG